MGLLSEGEPLSWEETKKLADHIRRHGIVQFINQYHRLKDRSKDCLMWGDEVGIWCHIDRCLSLGSAAVKGPISSP